jgi:hypothetical protein
MRKRHRVAWNFLVVLIFGVASIVFLGTLGLYLALGWAIAVLIYTFCFGKHG